MKKEKIIKVELQDYPLVTLRKKRFSSNLTNKDKIVLGNYAINAVIFGYVAYQTRLEIDGYEKDIYYNFDDRLLEHLKMRFKKDTIEYMMEYVKTNDFWNKLYRKRPDMRGYVSY